MESGAGQPAADRGRQGALQAPRDRERVRLWLAQWLCLLSAPVLVVAVNLFVNHAVTVTGLDRVPLPCDLEVFRHVGPTGQYLKHVDSVCLHEITGQHVSDEKLRYLMPEELTARYLWLLSYVIAMLSAFALIGHAALVIGRGRSRRSAARWIVGAILAGLAVAYLLHVRGYFYNAYFHANLRVTLKYVPMPDEVQASAYGFLGEWMLLGDYVAVITNAMFLFAMTSLCRPSGICAGARERASTLAQRVQDLQAILYTASAALALALMTSKAAMHWGVSPFAKTGTPAEIAGQIEVMDSGLIALWGLYLSLVLVAGYLPVALALGWIGKRTIPNSISALKERREWLEDSGLQVSLRTQVFTVIAFLAPLISGASGDVVGKLLG